MIGQVLRFLFKFFCTAFLWVTFLLIFLNLKPELPFEYPAVVSAGAVAGIWAFVRFVVMDH